MVIIWLMMVNDDFSPPLRKMLEFVGWDDDIPNIITREHIVQMYPNVPNDQPVVVTTKPPQFQTQEMTISPNFMVNPWSPRNLPGTWPRAQGDGFGENRQVTSITHPELLLGFRKSGKTAGLFDASSQQVVLWIEKNHMSAHMFILAV